MSDNHKKRKIELMHEDVCFPDIQPALVAGTSSGVASPATDGKLPTGATGTSSQELNDTAGPPRGDEDPVGKLDQIQRAAEEMEYEEDMTAEEAEKNVKANDEVSFEIAAYDQSKQKEFDFDLGYKNIEGCLQEGQSLIIKENNQVWKYDEDSCNDLKELLEAEETIDEEADLHYYNLTEGFDQDMQIDPILISRRHSRGVVQAIQQYQKDKVLSTCRIVGPPGIGKTRSLMIMLREHLLSDVEGPASVRFYIQKDEKAYWFIRIGKKLWCFTTKAKSPTGTYMATKLKGTMFQKSLVLLDPQEATKGGAQYSRPNGVHLVIACSDNEKHFPHGVAKESMAQQFYLGLWTRKELRRAHKLGLFRVYGEEGTLDPSLTHQEIDKRANNVGEVPRDIFNFKRYVTRVDLIKERAKDLTTAIVSQCLSAGPGIVKDNGTLAGCFFARENDAYSSDYSKSNVRYLSRYSLLQMYDSHRNTLLSTMEQAGSNPGDIFELLAGWDIHTGGDFVCFDMVYTEKAAKDGQAEKPIAKTTKSTAYLKKQQKTQFLLPDTPTAITRSQCVRKMLNGEPTDSAPDATLIGLSKCYSAIDYIGTGRHVYQVTFQEDHNRNGWIELLADAGIIASESSPLTVLHNAQSITFNWVVPSWRQDKWKNAAKKLRVKDCDLTGTELERANEILKKYVTQRVILIPKEKGTELNA